MVQIRPEHVEYALDEAARVLTLPLGELPWEYKFARESPGFWKFLCNGIIRASKAKTARVNLEEGLQIFTVRGRSAAIREYYNLRGVLTVVFSTPYAACEENLPRLSSEKVKATLESFRTKIPVEDIFCRMEEMQLAWAWAVGEMVHRYKLHTFSHLFLFALIQVLLDALIDEALPTKKGRRKTRPSRFSQIPRDIACNELKWNFKILWYPRFIWGTYFISCIKFVLASYIVYNRR